MNATREASPPHDPLSADTKLACEHCGLPVPPALLDTDAEFQFCCGGCEVAYETIRGCGLDDYYAYRDRASQGRQASSGAGKLYAAYDADAFLERHTTTTAAGFRAVDFRLEGVHCAACVWLIEKLPRVAPGVIEARLSLGSARARVVWDPAQTQLSTIAATLDRLGYTPHPARDASARTARNATERKRLVNMAIAGALAGNNMLIAVALYAGVFEGIEPQFVRLFRWLSLGIGWLSLAWPGATFFRGAWAACRARTANLDQPIALALGVGAIAGTANVLMDRGEIYFDSLSVLVFLLLVGRLLQARQQRWAEEAVGLMLSMTPDSCHVLREGELVDEPVEALAVGDTVEVRPGELFPADGEVVDGTSAIDQSLLTGESRPTPVESGDPVSAGSQNIASTLRTRVAAVGETTRVGKLIRLVEDGLAEKPPIVQFADRVAGWFVLVVVAIASANFAVWALTGSLGAAIDSTVALLIVACPCALGLATPLTMAIAIGRGSKQGMLIKSAAVLEKLSSVRAGRPGRLFVDKTGTLTTGELRVVEWIGDHELRPWIAAIEEESPHPIGRALAEAGDSPDRLDRSVIQDRVERHGFGITGATPIGQLLVGSPRFASEQGLECDDTLSKAIRDGQARRHTVVIAAIDGRVASVAWLRDSLHPETRASIDWLRQAGWRTEILSGDTPGPVQQIAAAIGLGATEAHGEVAPEEKLARIREAVGGTAPVMMVGDGVNDAAALAAADIGVAVHGGAEASLAAADVYLTEPGVGKLAELVRLGRETMRVTRRNLVISLAYNAVAVALAACGWITPLAAALIMPLSSLSVLASAVALATPAAKAPSPAVG